MGVGTTQQLEEGRANAPRIPGLTFDLQPEVKTESSACDAFLSILGTLTVRKPQGSDTWSVTLSTDAMTLECKVVRPILSSFPSLLPSLSGISGEADMGSS